MSGSLSSSEIFLLYPLMVGVLRSGAMKPKPEVEEPVMSSELARALGSRGGKKGGGKWFNSLSEKQQKAHIRRMVAARRKKKAGS